MDTPDGPPVLRIGELSRRLGVSDHVLRAWESRYGLLQPVRSAGGFRLYSEADESRVRRMQAHLARGLSAAEAARAVLGEDNGAGDLGRAAGPHRAAPTAGALPDDLRQALDAFDEPAAQAVLDRLVSDLSLTTVLRDVVLPYLTELGERWESGTASVAQEHFASNVIRGRLAGLARGWGNGHGPRAVLACPPGELHDLALMVFGIVLNRNGWRIDYLGMNTPDLYNREHAARERAAKLKEEAAELTVKDNDAYFGLPPILESEDLSAYQHFLKQVSDCLKPEDVLEMIWVRDVVDQQWDIDRMRRIKAALIDLGRRETLEAVRDPLRNEAVLQPEGEDDTYDFDDPDDVLFYNVFGEDEGFVETIYKLLKITHRHDVAHRFNDKALLAGGLVRYASQIARVGRMITTMETRRDKAVRELDRRRKGLGARTRRAFAEVENAAQVEETSASQKKAA